MDSSILFAGFASFFICLLLHVALWRWRYPQNRPVALVLIFIILPPALALGYLGMERLGPLPGVEGITSLSITDWSAIYLLHFALSTSYILSYPAAEAVSPSLMILLMIGDSKSSGLLYEDMLQYFDDGNLLQPRIKDLIEAGWIVESEGSCRVTSRGIIILSFYMLLYRLLGMSRGRG
jgi:membrane-bound metal-dependent hydrolase YbcI (DUF457 family)